MASRDGVEIVLTAPATDMSNFGYDAFVAFSCTFPYRLAQSKVRRYLRPPSDKDGTALFAPYGLRKVEALLVREFGRANVAVVHPDMLDRFVGQNTKLICISVHDPAGLAYVSVTYNSLISFGGETLNHHEFKRLMENPCITNFRGTIVAGGPGVWQIRDANLQDKYGIDGLLVGEAERSLISIIHRLINGGGVEKHTYLESVDPGRDEIPTIVKPSTFGAVEITRGCGRGCQFCTPTMRARHSFSVEHIMKEVEVNVKGGSKSIFIVSDDIFLYQSLPSFKPNTQKIVELIKTVSEYPGVQEINLPHASIAPVVYDPDLLKELSPILLEKSRRKLNGRTYITTGVGIETGSMKILRKYMRGKALPYRVKRWHEIVTQGLGIMNDHSWYPLCTFMTGMPDESDEDVIATLELLDRLKGFTLFYVPLLFVPFEEAMLSKAKRADLKYLTDPQWELLAECWSRNLDIWAREKSPMYRALGFFIYWTYLRWRHGGRSTEAAMKFTKMARFMLRKKIGKECDPVLCLRRSAEHEAVESKAQLRLGEDDEKFAQST